MNFSKIWIAAGIIAIPFSVSAAPLPTPEEVQGTMNACGAGRSVEVIGELDLSFKKLFSADIEANGKVVDIIGIISSIENDDLKVKVFEMYLECVMPKLHEATSEVDTSVKNNNSNSGIIVNGGITNINNGKNTVNNSTIGVVNFD